MSAPADTVFEDAPESWPVESTTEVFRNWLIGVRNDEVRMPGDRVAERSVVTHPGAVSVLALDDAGRALMIRQYRHPVGRLLWELPAGLRDHAGEPLVDAAKRELLEETGYRASTWHTLVDHYSSPGFTTERVRIFLARDLRPASEGDRGPGFVREHEEALIVTAWLPLPDAVSAILAGKLHNGHTIAGLLAGHVAASRGFRGLRPADAIELPDLPEKGAGGDEGWRSQGGQEPRVPRGHHSRGRARASPQRPPGLHRGGGGHRVVAPGQ